LYFRFKPEASPVKGERKAGKISKKRKEKRFQRKNFSKNTLFQIFLLKYICFEAGRHPCEREPEGSEGKWRRIFDLKILG
jgi:hypothetical protein